MQSVFWCRRHWKCRYKSAMRRLSRVAIRVLVSSALEAMYVRCVAIRVLVSSALKETASRTGRLRPDVGKGCGPAVPRYGSPAPTCRSASACSTPSWAVHLGVLPRHRSLLPSLRLSRITKRCRGRLLHRHAQAGRHSQSCAHSCSSLRAVTLFDRWLRHPSLAAVMINLMRITPVCKRV